MIKTRTFFKMAKIDSSYGHQRIYGYPWHTLRVLLCFPGWGYAHHYFLVDELAMHGTPLLPPKGDHEQYLSEEDDRAHNLQPQSKPRPRGSIQVLTNRFQPLLRGHIKLPKKSNFSLKVGLIFKIWEFSFDFISWCSLISKGMGVV